MIVRCVLPDILMIIFATDLGAIFEGVIYGGIGWVQTDAKLDSDKFGDDEFGRTLSLWDSIKPPVWFRREEPNLSASSLAGWALDGGPNRLA